MSGFEALRITNGTHGWSIMGRMKVTGAWQLLISGFRNETEADRVMRLLNKRGMHIVG